jgi:hypothetical protein
MTVLTLSGFPSVLLKPGLSFARDSPNGPLIISKIDPDGLFADTQLVEGLIILTLQGKDVTWMDPNDANAMLQPTNNMLLWSEYEEMTISVEGFVGKIIRNKRDESLGIILRESIDKNALSIEKIEEGSKFLNTELKEGMKLVSINGSACSGSANDAIKQMKNTIGKLKIVAIQTERDDKHVDLDLDSIASSVKSELKRVTITQRGGKLPSFRRKESKTVKTKREKVKNEKVQNTKISKDKKVSKTTKKSAKGNRSVMKTSGVKATTAPILPSSKNSVKKEAMLMTRLEQLESSLNALESTVKTSSRIRSPSIAANTFDSHKKPFNVLQEMMEKKNKHITKQKPTAVSVKEYEADIDEVDIDTDLILLPQNTPQPIVLKTPTAAENFLLPAKSTVMDIDTITKKGVTLFWRKKTKRTVKNDACLIAPASSSRTLDPDEQSIDIVDTVENKNLRKLRDLHEEREGPEQSIINLESKGQKINHRSSPEIVVLHKKNSLVPAKMKKRRPFSIFKVPRNTTSHIVPNVETDESEVPTYHGDHKNSVLVEEDPATDSFTISNLVNMASHALGLDMDLNTVDTALIERQETKDESSFSYESGVHDDDNTITNENNPSFESFDDSEEDKTTNVLHKKDVISTSSPHSVRPEATQKQEQISEDGQDTKRRVEKKRLFSLKKGRRFTLPKEMAESIAQVELQQEEAKVYTARVLKSKADDILGFKVVRHKGKKGIFLSRISEGSGLWNSALKPGMRITSFNKVQCPDTIKEVVRMVKNITGILEIQAINESSQ